VAASFFVPALSGQFVRLEPLSFAHVDALVEAANEDRSTYGFTLVPRTRDEMSSYVETLLAQFSVDETIPFVQIDLSSSRVVGATRYLTIRTVPSRTAPFAVEIGGTWLATSAQRTALNTEAKFLLLNYAFTTWEVARVDFKTDARNERSRSAILRLGAVFEGVLRQSQPSMVPGEELLFRDSAFFSILNAEWPAVASKLQSMWA
jgi:RimJ/RimL family protein N-acetyltransferase